MQTLDSILKGEEEVIEQVEAAEAEAPEPVTEPEPTGEKQDSTPEPEKPKEKAETDWHVKAIQDERRKRQELERKLAELQNAEEKKRPDVFEDPEGAFKFTESQIAQQVFQVRVEMSREMMALAKPDYEEKEALFVEMVKENPILAQELQRHPNPAKFAYETASKALQLKEMENLDEYKAKLKAEIRAEIEAELKQQQAAEQAKRQSIPPTLANKRAAAPLNEQADEDLKSILGR